MSLQVPQGAVVMESTGGSDMPGQPAQERPDPTGSSHLEFLHRISERLAIADPLHEVLDQIVGFLNEVVGADSCFIYLLEGEELVLRASKNPHPESVDSLRIPVGQGITGWVAERRETIAISEQAGLDHRFRGFSQLPEDGFEAFLSVPILAGGRLIGVLNLQHRRPHAHPATEISLVSTIGHLVGAEVERARLDGEVAKLAVQLETRKLLERAKGILQRDLGLTEEQSYLKLQQESRRRRIPMKQVAEAVVLSEELRRSLPDCAAPASQG